MIKTPRVFNNNAATAGLNKTASQFKPDVQRDMEENNSPVPEPNGPEPSDYAIERAVGYHGGGNQTKYKVQ